jgi:pilus assembly protein CpaF
MDVSLAQSRQAFPLVVFAHKCEDSSRKIMDISECAVTPEGKTEYRCLYRYNITKNDCIDGRYDIEGEFIKVNDMSDHLITQLTRSGVPEDVLRRYISKNKKSEL